MTLRERFDEQQKAAARSGPNNSNWRGEDAGYRALHYRIESQRGTPSMCEACGANDPKGQYDWANITGDHHNPDDYRRLCRSCHMLHDKQ